MKKPLILRTAACLCLTLVCAIYADRVSAEGIQWSTDLEGSLRAASVAQRPVLMEFTASWCVYCKRMEKTTFTDRQVVQRVQSSFVPVRIDADRHKELVQKLEVRGLPAILIVSPDLRIIDRISGFQTPEALIQKLDVVIAGLRQNGTGAAPIASRPRNTVPPAHAQTQSVGNRNMAPGQGVNRQADGVPRLNLFEEQAVSGFAAAQNPADTMPDPANTLPKSGLDDSAPFHEVSASAADNEQKIPVRPAGRSRSAAIPDTRAAAFKGVCVVTAVQSREIVKGQPQYSSEFRGQTLWFQGPEQKALFDADPERFWPMLDGACAVTLSEDGQRQVGDFHYAAVFRKRVWLFSSEDAMRQFLKEPAEYAEEALEQLESAR